MTQAEHDVKRSHFEKSFDEMTHEHEESFNKRNAKHEESFNKMNDDMDAAREQVDKRRMQEDKFSQHARDQEDKSSQDARAHHKEAFETEKDAIAANHAKHIEAAENYHAIHLADLATDASNDAEKQAKFDQEEETAAEQKSENVVAANVAAATLSTSATSATSTPTDIAAKDDGAVSKAKALAVPETTEATVAPEATKLDGVEKPKDEEPAVKENETTADSDIVDITPAETIKLAYEAEAKHRQDEKNLLAKEQAADHENQKKDQQNQNLADETSIKDAIKEQEQLKVKALKKRDAEAKAEKLDNQVYEQAKKNELDKKQNVKIAEISLKNAEKIATEATKKSLELQQLSEKYLAEEGDEEYEAAQTAIKNADEKHESADHKATDLEKLKDVYTVATNQKNEAKEALDLTVSKSAELTAEINELKKTLEDTKHGLKTKQIEDEQIVAAIDKEYQDAVTQEKLANNKADLVAKTNYDKTLKELLNTEQPTEKEPQQEIKKTSEKVQIEKSAAPEQDKEVQIEKSAAPEQEKEKKASVTKSAAQSTNKIGPTKLGAPTLKEIKEEAIQEAEEVEEEEEGKKISEGQQKVTAPTATREEKSEATKASVVKEATDAPGVPTKPTLSSNSNNLRGNSNKQ